jgi:mitotic spindle assembly checkpoint protein MAD2
MPLLEPLAVCNFSAFVDVSRLVLHSILYQRGIYPDDSFKQTKYHELSVHVTKEPQLKSYLDTVMKQMQGLSCLHSSTGQSPSHTG